MSRLLAEAKAGEVVWNFTRTSTLKQVKASLLMLGEAEAEHLGWKAWRAGRASEMTRQGHGLGEVLTAGEWKGRAVLNYVNETAIDAAAMLNAVVEGSEDEID